MAVPQYTDVKFANACDSNQILKLHAVTIWHGAALSNISKDIKVGHTLNIKHYAGNGDSVGGLEYEFADNNCTVCTLIVAWSNNGRSNKVYTEIFDKGRVVFWAQIKENLENSGSESDTGDNPFEYKCSVGIDPNSGTPTLTATFSKAK